MSSQPAILEVDVQNALGDDALAEQDEPPSHQQLHRWAQSAYLAACANADTPASAKAVAAELTIRLVSEQEICNLNATYRQKDNPTNVLAFPVVMPDVPLFFDKEFFDKEFFDKEFLDQQERPLTLLGDVVVCHPVLIAEATRQNKTLFDHYAHIVTHGVLHLCGFDHIDEQDAQRMEMLEIAVLANQGIANPYH